MTQAACAEKAAAGHADLCHVSTQHARGGELLSPAPTSSLPSRLQYQGTTMADEWPLRDFIELGALPSAVGCARSRTKQLLWEWGLAESAERVELIVSELATNAVKASQAMHDRPPIRLWLLSDKERVLVLVWDACQQPPIRVHSDPETEGGRGLLLIESFSDKWDWYRHRETGGKVVWAICQTRGGV